MQPWVPAPVAPLPAFRGSFLPHPSEGAVLFAQEAGQPVLVKLLALDGLHLTLTLPWRNSPWRTVLLGPRACCTWELRGAVFTETGVWESCRLGGIHPLSVFSQMAPLLGD